MPTAAEVIELAGAWVCPGLMNAHAHLCLDGGPDPEAALRGENRTETVLRSAARLEAAVRAGVTTIRDVGGSDGIDIELARLVESGEVLGPRVIASGRVVTMTGGHGWWMGIQADGADAVRRAARENLRAGAGSIKLMATGGMMTGGRQAGQPQLTVEEMAAAVDEAHKRGVPVAAHAESRVGVLNAIAAGVDSVEHGHGGDEQAIEQMLERGVALVPTILSDRRIIEHGVGAGIPDFVVEQCDALHQSLVVFLERAIQAGVTIAAGNDGGAPLVPIGDMVGELELYRQHGMSHPGGTRQRHDRDRRPVRTRRTSDSSRRATWPTCWSSTATRWRRSRRCAHRGVSFAAARCSSPWPRRCRRTRSPCFDDEGRAAMIVGAPIGR